MQRREAIAATWCALLLGGCTSSALDMAPSRPDRPWRPLTGPGGEIVPGSSAQDTGTAYLLPPNAALGVATPPPALDAEHAYTLPELIDIAQSNNPETRIAWNNARNAALAAGIAASAYLPRVAASVAGGYQYSRDQTTARGLNLDGNNAASGAIAAVSLQWLLFDFGERAAITEAANQASVISNIAFTAAHQRLIHDVCLAFYAHAAALARVDVAMKSLKNAQEVEAAADDRFKHGVGSVIAVAQARQATAQARLGQVQARGAVQNTGLGLLTAMGVSPLARIRVAPIHGRKLSIAMAEPVDKLVADALARRPDVLSAYAAQKASLANERAAEADFRPKVFLSATGAYNAGQLGVTSLPAIGQQAATYNITGNRFGSTVIVGMSVPLYDGATRDAVLKQARANTDKAGAALDLARSEAVRQIVAAQNALATNLSAYEASAALETAAQTTYDAALEAYRRGVGSITDVTVAETQLLQARNAGTDAYSASLSAAATLAFATGALGAAPAP